MQKIIMPEGLYGNGEVFSLEILKDVIERKCKNENFIPVQIKLEFWDIDEMYGVMAVSLMKDLRFKFNSACIFYVFLFELWQEDYKEYLPECYEVKRFLKKTYPGIRISSNFR